MLHIFFSGDWRIKNSIVVMWGAEMRRRFPDGLSTEDLAELMLGCLQAIDTFGSPTNVKPAKSRWWTMAAVVSKQALHLLLYDILPKSLAGAFPWKDIGEPSLEVHDGQDTADNDYRKMIRSKCRRAIVYTKAFELRRLGLCITLGAEPIDHLAMCLQHETAGRHLLLSILHQSTNPFYETQLQYDVFCTVPPADTELDTAFHFYGCGQRDAANLSSVLLEVILTISALLWFMCETELEEWPFPLVASCDVLSDFRHGHGARFYAAHACDLDVGCGDKIRAFHPTLESMLSDCKLMGVIKLWAYNGRVENMALERLLAKFKRAVWTQKAPFLAKAVSVGLLTQVLATHIEAGGKDPRRVRRSDLLADDMPILANKPKKLKKTRAVFAYANQQYDKYKAEHGTQRMGTRLALMGTFVKEFHTLPPEKALLYQRKACVEENISPADVYDRNIADRLWGMSSIGAPMKESVLENIANGIQSHETRGRGGFCQARYQDFLPPAGCDCLGQLATCICMCMSIYIYIHTWMLRYMYACTYKFEKMYDHVVAFRHVNAQPHYGGVCESTIEVGEQGDKSRLC